ncbi:MAG: type IV pilin protein [Gammaproteobacteria bacterium]
MLVVRSSSKKNQFGRTLLELVMTVAVIGVIASVAVPDYRPNEELTFSIAAESIASAARFARERASLTGQAHGVSVDENVQELSVFRLDETVDPAVAVFDVYHPISKNLYVINFATAPLDAVIIYPPRIKSSVVCNDATSFLFDAQSNVHCLDPLASRVLQVDLNFEKDGRLETVEIDGYTGRISQP